jgi:hypothetical protein
VKRNSMFQLLFMSLLLFCFAGTAVAGGVTLAWDGNDDTQVTGYRLYYQSGSATVPLAGSAALEGPSPIDVGNALTFTLNGLDEGQIHYFAVTAYNAQGVESILSQIVASGWVPAARLPVQESLVAPDRVVFQWTAPPSETRIASYRLYYSTDPDQLATAVSGGLAQAMGGSALAASLAFMGIGLGRSGFRRRNWLAMAMLAALIGAYGCGGGGEGSPPVQIPSDLVVPVSPGDSKLSAVSVVPGLLDTYHTVYDLQPSTTYFWKVVAIDEGGQEFEGSTYHFTTESF